LTVIEPYVGSVIPVNAIAIARDRCGYCAVFKDRRRQTLAVAVAGHASVPPPGSRRSLKAQQHAGHRYSRARKTRSTANGRPGSVDVLGPTVARAGRYGPPAPSGRLFGAP